MWVPFQVTPKSMKYHDKARGIVFSLVYFPEHPEDDTSDGIEQTVQEITVFQKMIPQVFINGKDEMAVFDKDQLEGHICSAFHEIFVATGGAKTALATEWDKFYR